MPRNSETGKYGSLWLRAQNAAERTPESRNRYIDFLRGASIIAVVLGHWLALAPHVTDGQLQVEHILQFSPWTAWLTWGFQVMPIFFMVGGYANAASWESALRKERGYGEWVAARLHRLAGPVVLLVVVWTVFGVAAHFSGISAATLAVGSRSALIPVWFLSVYIMVVVAAPLSYWAFQRAGAVTFWGLAVFALLVDIVGLAGGYSQLRWLNYGFVWLAVHQLGYLWRADCLGSAKSALLWAASGFAVLMLLVTAAGYPVGMISIPGEPISNSTPPTIALIALALLQGGLLLSFEGPMRHWLRQVRPWAATILVNRSIMTLYLWHMTVFVIVIGLLDVSNGIGLTLEPGTWLWWLVRPIWLAGLALILGILTLLLSPLEQRTRKRDRKSLPLWQALCGASMICFGLAQMALHGIGDEGPLGVRLWLILVTLLGFTLVSHALPSPPNARR